MQSLDLPDDLPVPEDDGAASHLAGTAMPSVSLQATDDSLVDLAGFTGRTVVYIYPMTGRPDRALPDGWDAIPGARGCTPQSCAFRDHHAELATLGARVFGLSSQTSDYQREAHARLHLPFALLSDSAFALADALRLPTFDDAGERLYRRLTLILQGERIEHVFYPVFPPNENAERVLDWLRANPSGA